MKKETNVPELGEKETKISKPRPRYRRFKEAEEDDKKNTFLPKRHAEAQASVPKPICEERDVSAESVGQAHA